VLIRSFDVYTLELKSYICVCRKKAKPSIYGYTIKELKGWIVKEYENGTIEKIAKLEFINRPCILALD
jgi:hypothetical protein